MIRKGENREEGDGGNDVELMSNWEKNADINTFWCTLRGTK